MKKEHECPICEEVVVSDATTTEYCALCSMIIKEKSTHVLKFDQENKYFCCETCRDKFKNFMQRRTEDRK